MLGGDNWYYFQMMQYQRDEQDFEGPVIVDVDKEHKWIMESIIAHGDEAFAYYNKLYESMPICKPFLFKNHSDYEDCVMQKYNCCYEKTREHFLKG
jgi:hypothetical protein